MASHSSSDKIAVYGPVPSDRRATGSVRVPGSKSITQRYFCLALLGAGGLEVRDPLLSDDTRFFLAAMETLGFEVEVEEGRRPRVRLKPGPKVGSPDNSGDIWCGAGGTMFRFLTAALTAVPGRWRIDGIPRLRERPVGPLIDSLRQLGARIDCEEHEGHAPLLAHGGSLQGGRCTLDAGASSQYLSAVLMAALTAPQPVTVEALALTSEPYVDLTVDAIRAMGGEVEKNDNIYKVRRARPTGDTVQIEADFSSVAYPAAAAALTGGDVMIEGAGADSRQGDRGFIDVLERMGVTVQWTDEGLRVRGDQLHGDQLKGGQLQGIDADLESMPDQVPTLAALAPFAEGVTRITNVPNLRIKESDRLAAMTEELRRAGAEVEELADGLIIPGVWAKDDPPTEPVTVKTHGDHRIAMAMALVGLRRPGLSLAEPDVVAKSYPDFWRDLEELIA